MLKTFIIWNSWKLMKTMLFANDAKQNFQFLKTCDKYTLHTKFLKLDCKIENS
jgi:hypothetical protein